MMFGAAAALAYPHLTNIEGLVRPVVVAASDATQPSRDETKACLSHTLHKNHEGEPIVYQFFVEVRQNEHWLEPQSVNAHIANEDNTPAPDDYIRHKVGATWKRRWCFDMPASVSNWQVIRVHGYAVHRVHPIWDTHSPLPSLIICPGGRPQGADGLCRAA